MPIYVGGETIAEGSSLGEVRYNANNASGNVNLTTPPGNGGWGTNNAWIDMYDFTNEDDYSLYLYYADIQSNTGYQNLGFIWKVDGQLRIHQVYEGGTQAQVSGVMLQMKQTSGADQRWSAGIIKIVKLVKFPQ